MSKAVEHGDAIRASAPSGNILDYGAVPDVITVEAAVNNSRAIEAAAAALCTPASSSGCTVTVPDNQIFYIHPVNFTGYVGLTLNLTGLLRVHNNISAWPRDADNKSLDVFSILQCENFTLTGDGALDGQGYDWWWWAILGGETGLWKDSRPDVFTITQTRGILLENVEVVNSPKFNFRLHDCADLVARHLVIRVDVEKQKTLLREHNLMKVQVGMTEDGRQRAIEIPTFPLNTDGIDPSVNGAHIYNVTIENFDDAVAIKPCSSRPGNRYCNCSSNILVEDSTVKFGVGMTIGSVPPDKYVNCVENITFRNIVFHEPLKGVYVKTNPGDSGSGRIQNVTYENLHIIDPVWWGIYIGPQQQQQPGGDGPGCMTYPLKNCPTQPRVPMDVITLRNITMTGGVNPFAGVIRCNVTRPCTRFRFENVNVKEALDTENYIVEYIDGTAVSCSPTPDFAIGPTSPGASDLADRRNARKPRQQD